MESKERLRKILNTREIAVIEKKKDVVPSL